MPLPIVHETASMENLARELENIFGQQRIRVHEPLSNVAPQVLTRAGIFLTINDAKELVDAVIQAKKRGVEYAVLDIDKEKLVGKDEFLGLVIKNDARKLDIIARKGKIQKRQTVTDYALLEAESGVSFTRLVRFAIEEGLSGVEEGLGIKGSIASLFQTEKEYLLHLEESGVLQSIKVLGDNDSVKEVSLSNLQNNLLVLSVVFKLVGEDKKILWLKAQRAAEKRGVSEFPTM